MFNCVQALLLWTDLDQIFSQQTAEQFEIRLKNEHPLGSNTWKGLFLPSV